jgi:hypothetical protein
MVHFSMLWCCDIVLVMLCALVVLHVNTYVLTIIKKHNAFWGDVW